MRKIDIELTAEMLQPYICQRFTQEFSDSPLVNEGVVRSLRLRDRNTLDMRLTVTRHRWNGNSELIDSGQTLSLRHDRYHVWAEPDGCLGIRYTDGDSVRYITLMHQLPSVVELKRWFAMT